MEGVGIDGGLSRGSSMHRPGSEDPHRRQQKFWPLCVMWLICLYGKAIKAQIVPNLGHLKNRLDPPLCPPSTPAGNFRRRVYEDPDWREQKSSITAWTGHCQNVFTFGCRFYESREMRDNKLTIVLRNTFFKSCWHNFMCIDDINL